MQCPHCNTLLVAGAGFCGNCGNPVTGQGGYGPEAQRPTPDSPHDGVTMAAPMSPNRQPTQASYPAPMSPNMQSPQAGYPTPPPATYNSSLAQPQAAWSPQPPQGAWASAPQPPGAAFPNAPRNMQSAGKAAPPRRKRKWPLRVALVFVLLVAVLAGGWFFGVRPYLNNLAETQINQAISDAQSQVFLLQTLLPTGRSIIPISEQEANNYLSTHASDQLQNLHMTITPTDVQLNFTVDGFGCTIIAVPIAVNGTLQVTNVQTQGVLAFVLSGDELANTLNTSLPGVVQQMNRKIDKVTLHNHVMDIQIH